MYLDTCIRRVFVFAKQTGGLGVFIIYRCIYVYIYIYIYIIYVQGRGKRTGGLGAFLLGCRNADTGEFETGERKRDSDGMISNHMTDR